MSYQGSNQRKPILVTGGHRTGTTWVGRMLAASGEVAFINEPLNVLHRPGVMAAPVDRWYTYICRENESGYLPALRQTLAFRYRPWAELFSIRSRKDVLRMGRDWSTFLKGRARRLRPLLKDPFAVFSAIWFAERLNCDVVITVRHPAAFASSLKRLGWAFQLEDLLAQPHLMRDWLEPFSTKIRGLPAEDVIGRAAWLWKMIYHVVDQLRQQYPRFHIVLHEELSLDPVRHFRSLFASLNLDFSARAQLTVQDSSRSDNPKEVSTSAAHAIRLDSRANLDNWKRRLATQEVDRIHQITASVAERYYPESAWGME